jgi:hypothetical protein
VATLLHGLQVGVPEPAFLERAGVTHVLLTGPGPGAVQLDALLGAAPGRLRLVRRWPGERVAFEVTREP